MTREATAWDSIGWDDGPFRIKGGGTEYEAVMYNCANNGRMVKLARLETQEKRPGETWARIREIRRYVEPDTVLVFENDKLPVDV